MTDLQLRGLNDIPIKVWDELERLAGFGVNDRIIYACMVGSPSHNTYVPKDDKDSIDDIDVLLVCVPPKEKVYGLRPWKETEQVQIDEWDIILHSIRRYTELLLKSNPNRLCTLWVRPEHQVYCSPEFKPYLDNRDLFTTKEAFHSFAGYANAQLKKMTASNAAYSGYMGAKRKALVDKFGYDCKNASHLLRLVTMCKEYMETGQLNVYRTQDAQMLQDIKAGKWKLEEVTTLAETRFFEAFKAYEQSALPASVDDHKAEKLMMEVLHSCWRTSYAANEP